MDIPETIDAALADLKSMSIVPCGAVHERDGTPYDAVTCALRKSGNLACCHPAYPGSAVRRIREHLSTVLRLERAIGFETIGPTPLRGILDNAEEDLGALDAYLAAMHARGDAATVILGPDNEQEEHAARIDVVRKEVMDALETLREYAPLPHSDETLARPRTEA